MGPVRMLVADDSRTVQAFFQNVADRGVRTIEIVTADTGGECLAHLESGQIDVAFVDVNMPEMSGMEAVGRARFKGCRSFVALMSGRGDEMRFEVARQLGVYEYLVKPFTAADVERVLATFWRVMTPLRTLIVDDSKTIRSVIRRVLSRSTFRLGIEQASSGEVALKRFDAGGFDLVFLDYNMPGLDGAATLARIRTIEPHARVIMISATRDEGRVKATMEAGASAFLFKPFFAADVDRALHMALGLKIPHLLANWSPPLAPRKPAHLHVCPADDAGDDGGFCFPENTDAWFEEDLADPR